MGKMRKDTPRNAYFTVEASLIFPFVMGVILLVIYMFFYKYDRVLMEQDLSFALLYGVYLQDTTSEERVEMTADRIRKTYHEEYFAWNRGGERVSYEYGRIRAADSGSLTFPFRGLQFWEGSNTWTAERSYDGSVIKKMFGIRVFRKMLNKGGGE